MGEKRSFLRFVVGVLAPIFLIVVGAAIAAGGLSQGWSFLIWSVVIVAGVGLLCGIVLLLLHGPLDWFD